MGKKKLRVIAILLLICLLSGCAKKVDKKDIEKGNGTYFMFNNLLHYYDADSGKAVPLCFDATCDHTSEKWNSCGSYKITERGADTKVGEYSQCDDGRMWHIGDYIYMIESKKSGEWTSIDTLVRYDRFGNNKETIVQLNDTYEYVGYVNDATIGVSIIDNYLYYAKTVRAGNVNNDLNKEVIYPEDKEELKELFANEEECRIHFAQYEYYFTFYRVPIDGSAKPEKISDEIWFYGPFTKYAGYVSRAIMIGGSHKDGITIVISDMGNSPNIYGDYFFEPRCTVYTYKDGDSKIQKNKEFTFEDEGFEGTVQWARYSQNVDKDGRLLFGTTEPLQNNGEIFRMYAYSPITGTYTEFYEKESDKPSIEKDGYENCGRVTTVDNEYIYILESSREYYHINVFDRDLKKLDTLNVDCSGAWGGPASRYFGIMATEDDYIIMGTSMSNFRINTDSGVIGLSESALKIHDNHEDIEDKYAQEGIVGMAYACVIDKSCIGTGKLKITKLMEYPYAGYKY